MYIQPFSVFARKPNGRGARAVEGARLESVCTGRPGTVGSNPTLSAKKPDPLSGFLTSYHDVIVMIESMTGFGRGTAQADGIEATVEIRSVNSRFCEVNARLPRQLSAWEAALQNQVKNALSRGRINVQVQLEERTDEELPIQVDPQIARAYAQLLEQLREAAGIDGAVRLEHLLNFSDIFTTPEESETEAEEAWHVVEAALEEALVGLRTMRREEGQALQADLEHRLDRIEHERLEELLEDQRLHPERLEVEIAVLADKLDVTEECVRLDSHLQLFREALASEEPVGRKLNFIVQEINREVNTIGSKANDSEIAHRAVQMKEELERIREQVQNVE